MKETLHARVVISMRYNCGKGTEKIDIELTGEALERHNAIATNDLFLFKSIRNKKGAANIRSNALFTRVKISYIVLRYIKNSITTFIFQN